MTGGIVLCGGQSRRMGRPKAWLPFGPEVLLQRVVRILGEVVDPIIVVAAIGQDLPDLAGSVIVERDRVPDLGPLPGLAVGLRALPDHVELAFVAATDSPFLRSEAIKRLVGLIAENDVAVVEVDGRLHPLAALYRRKSAVVAAEALVSEGRLRMQDLIDRLSAIKVESRLLVDLDPMLETFRNLNTVEDYEQALREAGFDS